MSTAWLAFPPLDTPTGYAQFLWRSTREKVVGEEREVAAVGMKPGELFGLIVPEADYSPLWFSVTLLDGRRLVVTVADEPVMYE